MRTLSKREGKDIPELLSSSHILLITSCTRIRCYIDSLNSSMLFADFTKKSMTLFTLKYSAGTCVVFKNWMVFLMSGVGRAPLLSACLAATLLSGSSGWAWPRTPARLCSTGSGCSRAVCSSTSNRNMTSWTVPFIIVS